MGYIGFITWPTNQTGQPTNQTSQQTNQTSQPTNQIGQPTMFILGGRCLFQLGWKQSCESKGTSPKK